MQRLTAIVMVPLAVWFAIAAIGLIGADRAAMVGWMHNPMAAMLMILAIIVMLYHLALGLQVVIEDYIHAEGWKLAWLIVIRVWCFLLMLRGILAVVKLALA